MTLGLQHTRNPASCCRSSAATTPRWRTRCGARINQRVAEILTENNPQRLQKLLEDSTKDGELSKAVQRLVSASVRMVVGLGRVSQEGEERGLSSIGARSTPAFMPEGEGEPAYAAGGSVLKDDPMLKGMPEDQREAFLQWVASEKTGEKTTELVTRRAEANGTSPEFEFARLQGLRGGNKTSPTRAADKLRDAAEQIGEPTLGFAEGGSVNTDGFPARESYFGGEVSTRDLPDRTVYDPKGASRAGKSKGVSASTRRDSVTDRTRLRIKSERVGRIMPAVPEAARSFWSQLKIAMIERAAVRGMDLGQIDWPE